MSDIPKTPEGALKVLLPEIITAVGSMEAAIPELRSKGHPAYPKIFTLHRKCLISARRIPDQEVREALVELLNSAMQNKAGVLRRIAEEALEMVISLEFEDHFMDTSDIAEFDTVNLETSEKYALLEAVNNARSLTFSASFLSGAHKRNVNYWLQKVENELHKENVGFASFVAATVQISGLVRRFGDDAKPLSEAIKEIRTTTENKVSGSVAIEADETPKQLEGPKKSS